MKLPPEWFFHEWLRSAFLPSRYAAFVELAAGEERTHRELRQFRIRAVLQGRGFLRRGDSRVPVAGNDLCLLPPGWQFKDLASPREGLRFLEVQLEFICSQGTPECVFLRLDLPATVVFPQPDRLQQIATACRPIVAGRYGVRERLLINPYVQELLGTFILEGFRTGRLRERSAVAAWLYEARNLIERQWQNPHFTVEVLASRFARSPSSLQHAFRKAFGCSISEYRVRYRIAMACRILRLNPDLKTGYIARQCGYRSVSLFYRHFRAETGATPKTYHLPHADRSGPGSDP